jgi:hypothetical protein
MTRASQRILAQRTAAVAAAAVLLTLAIVDPATAAWMPPCMWRVMTGWLCPGCGSARALHALLHADIAAAFSFNPLVVAFAPIAAVDAVCRLGGYASLGSPPPPTTRLIAPGLILFGILRNL